MKNNLPRKNLNVDKENLLPLWTLKEHDDVVLKLALFKNSVAFDITGQTIRLGAKTSVGLKEQNDGFTIDKNNLDIVLKNSILSQGVVELDLQLIDANGQMTTASFFILVGTKVLNDSAVEATNEFDTFTKTVEEIQGDYQGLRTIMLDENNAANLQNQINLANASLEQNQKQTNSLGNAISEIDVSEMYVNEVGTMLDIPCYVGDETVHPSLIYVPNGWNGHKYWMAFTPYEGSNNQVENPSIVCSDDGYNWFVPHGVTNPLVPAPVSVGKAVGSYNSDPVLFMDKDNVTMHIVFRECQAYAESQGNERLYIISSSDGWKTVTTPRAMVINKGSITRPVSPSVRWNGKEYLLWYVDIVPTP
ncbi:hypothetical protein PM741_13080, partial [Enterococcus faecium]|nr:hypothetical protein [Enterococcus faecium]